MLVPNTDVSLGQGALQQRLSTLTLVAMAFAILNTWIALAGSIAYILPSGGSVSFIYGFIFCVLCNLALAASLGELAAIWPTAGGQYHFMYALCTQRWKRCTSFFVGWTNIAGWLTIVTTQAFFAAQLISAAAVVASNGSYEATAWKTYLFFLAIISFGTAGNIWGNRILGRWNDLALYWSILAVVIISIILLSLSEKSNARQVFTEFNNETGWPDGLAWILGLLQSALSLIGFDVVLHLTEEMPNPSRDAPRAMLLAIVVGGVTGLVFIVVILFCLTDPVSVLSTSTGMPIVELFLQSTKSRAAATILALMLSICFINGPAVAFSAYVASCTIFLNISYASPIVALLVRGRSILREHQSDKTPAKMGLRVGGVVNIIAVGFVVITSIFFCFPSGLPVSANNMNYVSAVVGGFYSVITLYWLTYGNSFQGPDFEELVGERLQTTSLDATPGEEMKSKSDVDYQS
ncbi:hypothetical protein NW762_014409 [Fusarium torreyae]|uniref:Choline transport protein n=1 Tax=Fusarium torreyae TaxID=1237075 RepID=A0A9W8V7S9_9HYPO|nr:hypothetical protein NW762_014409 [Fusarium torreyae]